MAADIAQPGARDILVTLTIEPAPRRATDDFKLTAVSATHGYSADTPVIIGQRAENGGQLLGILVRIFPSPPPPPPRWVGYAVVTSHGTTPAPTFDPARPPIHILILVTIADAIKAKATSATAGYSVDEPSIRGSYALRGGRSVTLCVTTYPSPPPPPPPRVFPWWITQPDAIKFGRVVREARTRAGVSQRLLAAEIGVSEMTIRNIERGYCLPTNKTRDAVIAVLAAVGQPLDPNPPKDEPTE